MFTEGKSLIIVCAENTQKYGNYLMQLIGLKDDENGRIVGIEDGSVEAALWTEEEFEANRPTITSAQKIIFIGDSKGMKAERANMDCIFNEYGLHIDRLGNHGALYINEKFMNKEEYEGFLNFAKGYQKDYENVSKKLYSAAKKAVAFSLIIFGGIYGLAGSWILNWAKKRNEINDQRYGFLILYTYLEELADFIED